MKRRKQSRRWRGKKYAPVMIGMLVLLMNLADLKISNLISGSIICQAAERQSENTETENNSGGTEKEKITQTEASTVSLKNLIFHGCKGCWTRCSEKKAFP